VNEESHERDRHEKTTHLGVQVDDLALAAAHVERELARHAQRVRELGFAGSELTEQLGDGPGLDAAAEDLVQ
jgi:hypothetical protein